MSGCGVRPVPLIYKNAKGPSKSYQAGIGEVRTGCCLKTPLMACTYVDGRTVIPPPDVPVYHGGQGPWDPAPGNVVDGGSPILYCQS
jgi:hypothetical protein